MNGIIRNIAVGVLAIVCASTSANARENAPRRAPEATIQLEEIPGAGKALKAVVNGKEELFLFDTGEGVTTVAPQFARDIGCRPWGQITGFRMSGERLDLPRCDNMALAIEGKAFPVPIAGVFDIMKLLPDSKVALAGSAPWLAERKESSDCRRPVCSDRPIFAAAIRQFVTCSADCS